MQNQIDKIKGTIKAISVDDATYIYLGIHVKTCMNSPFYVYIVYNVPHCRYENLLLHNSTFKIKNREPLSDMSIEL